ncbi:MAG: hypothetical protein JW950_02760 [Deltaproteobacteria bacterium]|nr:hypothetical protein [Deltaproteobacteria bacterium]
MRLLKMNYGMSGKDVDAFGMRFYGELDKKVEHLGSISEMISDPDVPPMVKNKRVTLWFTLEKIRPYKRISDLLGDLMSMIVSQGYTIVVSSIDELVDTTSPQYKGKPESGFPPSDRMHGYNAASAFSITAEKTGEKATYTLAEIEEIQQLAVQFGRTVYGRFLPKVEKRR